MMPCMCVCVRFEMNAGSIRSAVANAAAEVVMRKADPKSTTHTYTHIHTYIHQLICVFCLFLLVYQKDLMLAAEQEIAKVCMYVCMYVCIYV